MMHGREVLVWLRRPVFALAMTLVACLALSGAIRVPLIDALDQHLYDARQPSRGGPADDRLVIVDVDDASLVARGRWPWPRATVADLLERIAGAGGAAVIGVDIVFAGADRDAGADDALAEVLRRRPVVLGYYFTSHAGSFESGRLPPPALAAVPSAARALGVMRWNGYGANLDKLQEAAKAGGFFNSVVDPDGVVRAFPALAEFRGALYDSFAVAILRAWLGGATLDLDLDRLLLSGQRGEIALPLSDGLSTLIPFATSQGRRPESGPDLAGATGSEKRRIGSRFRYVSAADVLDGRVDPTVFDGRIVLLGTSAAGLADLRATPVRALLPGVELHATMIAGALDARTHAVKRRSVDSTLVALISTALVGIGLAFGLPRLGPLGAMLASALAAGAVWLTGALAWSRYGLSVPVSAGLFLVAASALLNLAWGYFVEARTRRVVANAFGEYVSPALVERMMGDPGRYSKVASENRELSVLFVDICGFTRISESMSPEDLREYINAFLTSMTEVVHRYGGTIDKYIGDAVMAFWGAPVDDPRHADHAVAAALAMLDEVARLNRDFEKKGLPSMRVGIGINTGIVRVGDMGSRLRRAYTAIGSAVNLASRFEALTRKLGVPIVVGETTRVQARAHRFVDLGAVPVAAIAEPVQVYAPAGLESTDADRTPGPLPADGHRGDRTDEASRLGL